MTKYGQATTKPSLARMPSIESGGRVAYSGKGMGYTAEELLALCVRSAFYFAAVAVVLSLRDSFVCTEVLIFSAVSIGLSLFAQSRATLDTTSEFTRVAMYVCVFASKTLTIVATAIALQRSSANRVQEFRNGAVSVEHDPEYFYSALAWVNFSMHVGVICSEGFALLPLLRIILRSKSAYVEASGAGATGATSGNWLVVWDVMVCYMGIATAIVHLLLRLVALGMDLPLIAFTDTPFFFMIVSYFVGMLGACDATSLRWFVSWHFLGTIVGITGFAILARLVVFSQRIVFASSSAYLSHVNESLASGLDGRVYFATLSFRLDEGVSHFANLSAVLHGIYTVYLCLTICRVPMLLRCLFGSSESATSAYKNPSFILNDFVLFAIMVLSITITAIQ